MDTSTNSRARIWTIMMVSCLFPWIPCRATIGGVPPFSSRLDPFYLKSKKNYHHHHHNLLIRGGDEAADNGLSNATSSMTTTRRISWPITRSGLPTMDTATSLPRRWSTNDDMDARVQQTSTSRRQRPLEYRDILNCDSRQWSWTGETSDDEDDDSPKKGLARGLRDRNSASDDMDQSYVDYRGRLEGDSRKLSHSPVVYQYYGRSRIRGNPADSVHFILIGPNVDHWKAVGQVLASRGFNTIACERLEKGTSQGQENSNRNEDSPNLVMELMEALKWKKVIIVGCDSESILAMETAMMLSPDQVVGLVLAGDLAGSDKVAAASGVGGLDTFLPRVLECPFLIVWDGDSPTVVSGSSAHRAVEAESSDRCVILGGGSAPHRLKPEQFAWVLTRFVEERLEIPVRKEMRASKARPANTGVADENMSVSDTFLRILNLPFGVNTLVSPEGRLLLGRAIATGLFYITAMRVLLIQYGILRTGLIAIKSRYESIDALTKKGIQAVGAFVINFGYIPRLFTVKRANESEEDEDRRKGTIVLENQPAEEEEVSTDDKYLQGDGPVGGTGDVSDPEQKSDSPQEKEDSDEIEKESPKEEMEHPPLFKPFFFLDNVVT